MRQVIFTAGLLLMSSWAFAGGDAVVGEQKAQVCAACHGATGVPSPPMSSRLSRLVVSVSYTHLTLPTIA